MAPTSSLIQLFKPGRFTSADGTRLGFSEADLAATVAAYRPELHEAPLVVGHPTSNKPAYGWVKSLALAEGHLAYEPHQVDADFAELVNAGRFKKRSASFYSPTNPENPTPGVYYLRHVGYLGAAPPAVKGLRDASFSEAGPGVIQIDDLDFSEGDDPAMTWIRRLYAFFSGGHNFNEPPAVTPLAAGAPAAPAAPPTLDPTPTPTAPEPSPAPSPEAPMPTAEELAAQEAALKTREAAIAAREAAAASQEAKSFLEGLVAEGKMLPQFRESMASLLGALTDPTPTIEFSEDGKPAKATQADFLRRYLAAQPKVVEYRELGRPDSASAEVVSFSGPTGVPVQTERAELHAKAMAYQAAHPGTNFVSAYKAVGGK